MAFKFIAILAFVTLANAGLVPVQQVYHQAPVPTTLIKTIASPPVYGHGPQPIEAHHNAQYNYAYEVHDEHTGDIKRHSEERNGDVVHGEYSLIDADGYRRVVQYTVDPHSGFQAVVNRIPLQHAKATIVKQVTPVTYVAPSHPVPTVLKQYPVPVAYQQHY